jgi:hypothetical protein
MTTQLNKLKQTLNANDAMQLVDYRAERLRINQLYSKIPFIDI